MLAKLNFYLKHSLNDLQVNGRRTLFALLCIAAGVGSIVSLQTLGVMIDETLSGSLRETNRGDLQIHPGIDDFDEDSPNLSDNNPAETAGLIEQPENGDWRFTEKGINAVEEWFKTNYSGEVRFTYTQPLTDFAAALSISAPDQETDKAFVGHLIVNPQEYPLFGKVETVDGKPLKDILNNSTDIVLSENLADDLGVEVGDTVRLNRATENFKVTGIVPTDAEGGLRNFLAAILGYYYLNQSAVPLFEADAVPTASTIYVALDNPDLDGVQDLSDKFLARFPYFSTVTTSELEEQNSAISSVVSQLVTIMGLVSMLIGGIGIINTMLVIVSRRTTEVAVLKTLGMEPEEVTILFLMEAILMGIIASLLGVLLGWGMALALKAAAETFVAQSLAFRIALVPAFNGIIVGILVTAIFGFIPILAAGQIRPANVLRPTETIIPQNGVLRSFAALMFVLFALSLLTQGFISELMDFGRTLRIVTGINGAIIGLLMAVPIVLGGYLAMRRAPRGRSWGLQTLLWLGVLFGVPAAGFAFGYFVPSIIVMSVVFIIVGSLYLLLLLMIWAVSGAPLAEFPVIGKLSMWLSLLILAGCVGWTGFLAFMLAVVKIDGTPFWLFMGLLLPIHIPTVIVTLVIPWWIIGQLLQRYGFLDLRIALRSMASIKGRGAGTLLALVIGIFTLSTITMLVNRIQYQLDRLLENNTGGNVFIFPGQGMESVSQIRPVLDDSPGVNSYTVLGAFDTQFIRLTDVSQNNEEITLSGLYRRIDKSLKDNPLVNEDNRAATAQQYRDNLKFSFAGVDARELDSNLPRMDFYEGRQLDPRLDTVPDAEGHYPIVIPANDGTLGADIEVGDLLTLAINGDRSDTITFRIVGMVDATQGNVQGLASSTYTSFNAFGDREPNDLLMIADIEEDQMRAVRQKLNEIPGVFVLEIKLLNDLLTSVINQFTNFPILVTVLALFTGGIVIANSVALSTMERRREIGIMKAVGVQRERVLGMLLLENGLMGLAGGLIGVGMGVLTLIFLFVAVFQGSLGDAIPITWALVLMGLCIFISLIAAILSVWGASGEKPMNVLRYE